MSGYYRGTLARYPRMKWSNGKLWFNKKDEWHLAVDTQMIRHTNIHREMRCWLKRIDIIRDPNQSLPIVHHTPVIFILYYASWKCNCKCLIWNHIFNLGHIEGTDTLAMAKDERTCRNLQNGSKPLRTLDLSFSIKMIKLSEGHVTNMHTCLKCITLASGTLHFDSFNHIHM
jgi:hypothetical protein